MDISILPPHQQFEIVKHLPVNSLVNICVANQQWMNTCLNPHFKNSLLAYRPNLLTQMRTTLMQAINSNEPPKVLFMLKFGVDPNFEYFKTTPLIVASQRGHTDIVFHLISFGARVNEQVTETKPLIEAIKNNHRDVIDLLMKYGANNNLEKITISEIRTTY